MIMDVKLGNFLFVMMLIVAGVAGAEPKSDDLQLQLVQIVFRHGDRTPVNVYPNDPHTEATWDKYGGLGQLTQLGMTQHYNYGLYLRQRYAKFLNNMYNRNQVLVHSTEYDRTMMSAESLLSSLYAPDDYQRWNHNLTWQPIPVHTNNMENVFISNCARYAELVEEVTQTDEYISATKRYQDLIEAADKNSGYTNLCLKDLWKISDTVFVENNNDLKLPDWVQDKFDRFMSVKDLDFHFSFYNTEMSRLTAGGILNDISKNIYNKTHYSNDTRQLVLYSSHDTYVAGLTRLLNLSSITKQPPYTSSVIIELYKSLSDSKYFVQVYLKNNTVDQPINPILLPIYGCEETCPLEDFTRLIKDKIVDQAALACAKQNRPIQPSAFKSLTFLLSVSFVATVSLIVSVIAVSTCRKYLNRSGYIQQEL